MTSSRSRPQTLSKIEAAIKINPCLKRHAVDYYMAVLLSHCASPSANTKARNDAIARMFFRALHSCRALNEDFSSYFARVMAYWESKQFRIPAGDGLYNPGYLAVLLNITLQEAEVVVASRKAGKATSRLNFIRKHGPIKGEWMFRKFVGTSNWRPEYLSLKGVEAMRQKNLEGSKRTKHYWMKQGLSEEQAIAMVTQYQLENAGVNREYYTKRGIDPKQIDELMKDMDRRKDSRTKFKIIYIETYGYSEGLKVFRKFCKLNNDARSVEYFKRRYGDAWREKYEYKRQFFRNVYSKQGHDLANWREYRMRAWRETNKGLKMFHDKIKDFTMRSRLHHLDHVFSIHDGYLNKISPEIVGHWTNLRMLGRSENISKNAKSHKSLEDLISDYELAKSKGEI